MAPPTRREIVRLSGASGYDGPPLEKMIRLLDILQAIEQDRFLGGRLALKGGTALNAFHLGLKRLSMDIDLDYIGPLDESAMLAERNAVDTALFRILDDQGCRIKNWRQGPGGSRWDLRFASAFGGEGALKVDLGYIDRQPLFGASRMSSVDLGGGKRPMYWSSTAGR